MRPPGFRPYSRNRRDDREPAERQATNDERPAVPGMRRNKPPMLRMSWD